MRTAALLWVAIGSSCGDDPAPTSPHGSPTTASGQGTTSTTSTSTSSLDHETAASSNAIIEGSDTATSEGSTSTSPSSSSDGTETGGSETETGVVSGNCGSLVCAGHSACVESEQGASCVCDDGYVRSEDDPDGCIVDTQCIRFRDLGDGSCRVRVNGHPAVGLFFAVEYCAGTAVLPEELGAIAGVGLDELGTAFHVAENGRDVAQNPEAFQTIVDIDVESYVTIVLDLSASVTQSEDVTTLLQSVRDHLLGSLRPAPGEPDVYISVFAFGDGVRLIVPGTTDFDHVDAQLAAVQADPQSVYDLHLGPNGTDLFLATQRGIQETDRLRDLRRIVTHGGVLTTGTVVVVTDGRDESNRDATIIPETSSSVISIGISSNIRDEELQTIGSNGSILAPRAEDWAAAFQEIGHRVDEYPERAYLLGYCSTANSGDATVEVGLLAATPVTSNSVSCTFKADHFSPLALGCDGSTFERECDTQACGGITGCGACNADACCDGTSCIGPGTFEPCDDEDQHCRVAGEICVEASEDPPPEDATSTGGDEPPATDETSFVCEPPAVLGDSCEDRCQPGVAFCLKNPDDPDAPGTCVATLEIDTRCEHAAQCASLRCESRKPENPLVPRTCLEPARIGYACGLDLAVCEPGSYCEGGTCAAKKWPLEECSSSSECDTGRCVAPEEGAAKLCLYSGACFFAWEEKVPD